MFEGSLKLGTASGGRRAGSFSLAATAHLLILIPAGAISLLMVEEVVLPRVPTEIPALRVSLAERTVQPSPPLDSTRQSNSGERRTAPILGRRFPSGPPGERTAPRERPEAGLPDIETSPETEGSGELESLGPFGDPLGSLLGDPGGGRPGPGARGVDADGSGYGEPLPLTSAIEAPRLIRKVLPDYPAVARAARVSGRVFVKAVIAPTGKVVDVEVVSSSSPILNESALDAVRQWEYRPALRGGEPVAVYFTVVVNFILE